MKSSMYVQGIVLPEKSPYGMRRHANSCARMPMCPSRWHSAALDASAPDVFECEVPPGICGRDADVMVAIAGGCFPAGLRLFGIRKYATPLRQRPSRTTGAGQLKAIAMPRCRIYIRRTSQGRQPHAYEAPALCCSHSSLMCNAACGRRNKFRAEHRARELQWGVAAASFALPNDYLYTRTFV